MNTLHVIYLRGGWAVRRSDSWRASRRFEERDDAVKYAEDRAKTVYIHRKDGMVDRVIRN